MCSFEQILKRLLFCIKIQSSLPCLLLQLLLLLPLVIVAVVVVVLGLIDEPISTPLWQRSQSSKLLCDIKDSKHK